MVRTWRGRDGDVMGTWRGCCGDVEERGGDVEGRSGAYYKGRGWDVAGRG